MRDDDGVTGGRQLFGESARRLVDVDQHVGRLQFPQLADVDGLGAADASRRPDPALGMDAEGGATDHLIPQAQVEQQLGEARNQRHDPRRSRRHRPMADAGRIDQRAIIRGGRVVATLAILLVAKQGAGEFF